MQTILTGRALLPQHRSSGQALDLLKHINFITLQQEAYELCVPDALLDDPRVRALRAILPSVRYRQYVVSMPGCMTTDTGAERLVD